MKQVRTGGGRQNGTRADTRLKESRANDSRSEDSRARVRANAEWHGMSEELQTALAQQAMHRAAMIVAEQADMFARQFRAGTLQDRGAEDALRLFAALLRETSTASLTPAGHA
jgi:hypothetical protein